MCTIFHKFFNNIWHMANCDLYDKNSICDESNATPFTITKYYVGEWKSFHPNLRPKFLLDPVESNGPNPSA